MIANRWDANAYDSRFGFVNRYGRDLLGLLDPRPGEDVLDLGCGTGHHAAEIAALGAHVVGLDSDPQMLAKARREHPSLAFVAGDAMSFTLAGLGVDEPFDACFSNAALHWMTPQETVLRNVRSALSLGGRFVAEMGGAQNVELIDAALRAGLEDCGLGDAPVVTNYYPTVAKQAALLEATGFRVELANWFRRPTPLEANTSAADWSRHFREATWAAVPVDSVASVAQAVNSHAAAMGLLEHSGWVVDYCRLRFVAVAE